MLNGRHSADEDCGGGLHVVHSSEFLLSVCLVKKALFDWLSGLSGLKVVNGPVSQPAGYFPANTELTLSSCVRTSQTPQDVLRKWAIMRTAVPMAQAAAKGMLSAVLSGVPGAQVAHVLKTREAGTQPSEFELEILRRSCQALLEVRGYGVNSHSRRQRCTRLRACL